ncbi:hypothetical protein H4CHR_04237 [Variovorax sp. PBS-H4]|nr:hypothetical protein H4CHR_04237 [Variovorax sp. PBS-H4]
MPNPSLGVIDTGQFPIVCIHGQAWFLETDFALLKTWRQ